MSYSIKHACLKREKWKEKRGGCDASVRNCKDCKKKMNDAEILQSKLRKIRNSNFKHNVTKGFH